ncbi:MAG: hypothetical protein ABW007_11155 [Chitinophagaceae bacterium]
MKKISFLLLAGTIFLASCQKQNDELFQQQEVAAAGTTAQFSSWRSVNFSSSSTGKGAAATGQINDPAIDSAVVAGGMVLVFSKESNAVNTLPFTQASGVEWSYEIKNGGIQLSATDSKALGSLSGIEFSYAIVSSAKIASLEEKGTSADDLINLDYSSASALLAGK